MNDNLPSFDSVDFGEGYKPSIVLGHMGECFEVNGLPYYLSISKDLWAVGDRCKVIGGAHGVGQIGRINTLGETRVIVQLDSGPIEYVGVDYSEIVLI